MNRMFAPQAIAVVGFKDAGKTRVVEAIVREFTRRGHKVGTLKHTSSDHHLDIPGKDTWRHREAGSSASAILTSDEAAIFLSHPVGVAEAAEKLGPVDVLVLEGFRSLDVVPRILIPRSPEEIEMLANGLEIAISGPDVERLHIGVKGVPIIPISRVDELAELITSRAFPLLPGLNCGGCGYESCGGLARAILAGEAEAVRCVARTKEGVQLKVDGLGVAINPFVQKVMRNVVLGVVRTLKGIEEPRRVEVALDLVGDEDG